MGTASSSDARRRWAVARAVLALGVTVARTAGADEGALRVSVHATGGCSSEESFFQEVASRTPRVKLPSAAGDADWTAEVTIRARDGGAEGDLALRAAQGLPSRRHIEGQTCDEVAKSLALVVALAIDPEGVSRLPGPLPPPPEPPPPAQPPPPPPPAMVPPMPAPSPTPAQARSPIPALPPAESPRPPPRESTPPASLRASAGARAGGVGMGALGPLFEGGIALDIALERASVLSPSFRVSFRQTTTSETGAPRASGSFDWTYGSLDLCPIRVRFSRAVAFSPCATVDAGALSARGHSSVTLNVDSPTRAWFAAGALARLAWALPLGRLGLVTEVFGGAVFPATRQSFIFAPPPATVYQPPVVAEEGGADVLLRFW